MLTIDNLSPEIILDSKGIEMTLDLSTALADRVADIMYVSFHASVDCKSIDDRISTIGPLSTHFCLRLP